ncbi:MAG: hypothetical protein ACP5M7_09825 [Thermoproteota archaeon]|jgi:hypothetical protein
MKFIHQVEEMKKEMPKKGTFSVWDVAPKIAPSLSSHIKSLLPEGVEKIECRFFGITPLFVAIIHSNSGWKYAIKGDSNEVDGKTKIEMGFDFNKYYKISDSIACVFRVYEQTAGISREAFRRMFEVVNDDYEWLKKKYNEYSTDFTF